MDVIPESASERMKLVNSHSQFHLHKNNMLYNSILPFQNFIEREDNDEDDEDEYDDN